MSVFGRLLRAQVNNCNVDGAVRLRADDSDEEHVSQVATVLDNYVLQPNVTDACTLDPRCIVSGQPFTVGIGVSETQVRGLQRPGSCLVPAPPLAIPTRHRRRPVRSRHVRWW
jgi:hypothetical protein